MKYFKERVNVFFAGENRVLQKDWQVFVLQAVFSLWQFVKPNGIIFEEGL